MKQFFIIVLLFAALQLAAQKGNTVTFTVYGNCEMCKERIETAAKGKGVITATWDVDSKVLTLQYDPTQTSVEKVHQRIADAGHDTELKKSKDYVYKALPECCLYRDKKNGTHSDHGDAVADDYATVMGVVMESDEKGNFKPLSGANIIVKDNNSGVSTNANGFFSLELKKNASIIIISYAGFESKEITISKGQHLNIVLNRLTGLQEVKVVAHKNSMYVPNKSTLRTMVISEKELFKAACCNLSESFETNPSVDVSYNDAITGSKQIQLLGLSGNYSQLTIENMPGPRGIATPWGLNSIPGTWVESIQLTKGVGSVINGFESITGQVNVELRKPETADQLYANAYVNSMGKTDLNLNLAKKLSSKWATALLLHDAFFENNSVDFNKDGFRDLPTGNLFTMMNRWKFNSNKGLMAQFGFRILTDNKVGGQTSFEESKHKLTTDYYGAGIKTDRQEVFGKIGYVFPEKRFKSFGLQLSAFRHNQDSYFGLTAYKALQKNLYANFIYQSIIGNTNHKFRTGISFLADDYDETYKTTNYKRTENIPGAFFEYSYCKGEKFDLIAGIRGDHNSLFGFFVTPRLHIRYQPLTGTIIRFGTGRGQRTANIFAENSSVFVSSRDITIIPSSGGKAYGLKPEIAWSNGIGVDQKFRFFNRNGNIGIDFYRTDFENQVVVDLDKSAREVNFYNLDGKSFANSFQAEINYELLQKLDIRIAYRLFDVKSTYHGELMERPLVSKHRGFVNLAYEVMGWKFDYTVTYNGTKRIPYTGDNPAEYQLATRSPSYVLMNAQITKTFGNKFPIDVYLGSENLTNYYQDEVIIAANDAFGQYFDASMIWGPISGRMFYGGVRLKIK
ncbi:MAG TPA: carboxypeptidase-like regulatory domain-containing protein [Chitinophagaceae bacterium]|nr:carboxypeptidase-like regulatory domain-containing protein [Chitinophagaceae bacterium]